MSIADIPAGKVPDEMNVIIEIPANASPIKYEVDKDTSTVWVDRFMSTPMFYPANYGFVNQTLGLDGDPVDVLVITPVPLIPGVVVTCRPIGILIWKTKQVWTAKCWLYRLTKFCPFTPNGKSLKT
jgi:inorganic pyrophosphatase